MMLASVALSEVAAEQKRKQSSADRKTGEGQASDQQPTNQQPPQKPSAGPVPPAADADDATADGSPSTSQAMKTPVCPTIVLAHPAEEVARIACRTIERQLRLIKIPIRLVELKPGAVALPKGEYDLVYAELQIAEPVVDVGRLFGPAGLVPLDSPYLRAALGRLAEATDWKSARESLLRIHKIVADELPILPLYQLPEHFAYRRTIKGIGAQPASLYQNISGWQTQPELPAAE